MIRVKGNTFASLGAYFIICFVVGAVCWTGLLNELLIVAHKPPSVLWWQGGLIGMIPTMGWIGLIGYVGLWMVKLFL